MLKLAKIGLGLNAIALLLNLVLGNFLMVVACFIVALLCAGGIEYETRKRFP